MAERTGSSTETRQGRGDVVGDSDGNGDVEVGVDVDVDANVVDLSTLRAGRVSWEWYPGRRCSRAAKLCSVLQPPA